MSLDTLIADLAKHNIQFQEVGLDEEGVKSYVLANPPLIYHIQLNVCEQNVDLYIRGKSVYFKQYNDTTTQELITILHGYVN